MTKREVQVWFQNRRAKASRARAAAVIHSGPVPSSTVSTSSGSDYQHYSIANMMPRLALPPPTTIHHHQPLPQPFIQYTPPSSRRASSAFSDTSTPPTRSPIAPMPPSVLARPTSIVMPPPIASSYNALVPPTPPYLPPVVPRKHSIHLQQDVMENVPTRSRNNARQPAKKRPKSVIGVLNTTP
ncbi:unnamed protein product [Absidia cylindrospora]